MCWDQDSPGTTSAVVMQEGKVTMYSVQSTPRLLLTEYMLYLTFFMKAEEEFSILVILICLLLIPFDFDCEIVSE